MFDQWKRSKSELLEASRIVKAAPGKLRGVHVVNSSAVPLYCQVFDSATLPADTAVAQLPTLVPANGDAQIDCGPGLLLDNGIVVCLSTTQATKTLAGAVGLFSVQYI